MRSTGHVQTYTVIIAYPDTKVNNPAAFFSAGNAIRRYAQTNACFSGRKLTAAAASVQGGKNGNRSSSIVSAYTVYIKSIYQKAILYLDEPG